ncbi:hypothetical protein RJT34_17780 [Clitoria ternatea]|uniref:Uncharacterized protein n=1 Tax=Clitoria ternatea TaxID=43366 RepID=A0AAN9JAV9_CLITE
MALNGGGPNKRRSEKEKGEGSKAFGLDWWFTAPLSQFLSHPNPNLNPSPLLNSIPRHYSFFSFTFPHHFSKSHNLLFLLLLLLLSKIRFNSTQFQVTQPVGIID